MRPSLVLLLAAFVVWRVSHWARERDAVLDLCSLLEARQSSGKHTLFIGTAVAREGGIFALEGARAETGNGIVQVASRVWIEESLASKGLGTGRKLAVSGPARCRRPARNPGSNATGEPSFSATGRLFSARLTQEPVGGISLVREKFRVWISKRLGVAPGLRGLALATWTGDGGALPENLRRLYLEGGLLHILALSGQHVAVLAAIAGVAGRCALGLVVKLGPRAVELFARLGKFRLLFSAAVLAITCDGLAPLRRALAMIVLWEGLSRRRFHVRALPLVGGSAAALLILDPSLLKSPSFLLSVGATAFIGRLLAGPTPFLSYLRAAWVMPVLTAPLTAHYFGKMPWLAPVANFLLGGIWALVWLPLGFLAPFLAAAFPETLTPWAERGWTRFVLLQQGAEHWGPIAYGAVIRPGAWEAAAWELFLVLCLLPLLGRKPLEWGSIP